jgi:predicted permease
VLIVGAIGVVLGSGLLAWPFARLLHEDPRTFVPPMMFNNCGNMGLPLAVLAFGQPGLSAMVAIFTISNLLLHAWSTHRKPPRGILADLQEPDGDRNLRRLRLRARPPAGARLADARHPMTGDAMIPLMLISLGVRMATVSWGGWNLGVIGALVCPLTGIAMSALLAPVLGLDATQAGLLILFGCLPPAVLNFMVAEQYNQEPGKVASIVLIGNGASIVFVPIALSLALRQ